MRTTPLIAAFLAVFMLSSVIAIADTPVKQVALQGRLSDPTGKPLDGSFSVKFEIFASASAIEGAPVAGLWSEAQKVTVTKGLFGVNLGSATQGGIPLAFDKPYWVEVSIGAEKLSPRYPLTSAPYSFYGGVAGSITADKIIGTLNINQIPSLTADKIPALTSTWAGTVAASKITGLTANMIPALPSTWTGTVDVSKISGTGTLSADRIPMLDANKKIATGTITEPQIDHNAGLSAEILMHGALNPDRVPPLYKASWTATGAGRIDASFIGTGTYNNWVAGMPASMLTGALPIGLLPSTWPGTVDASKISGLTLAMLPTITGAKIGSKTITNDNIADGTITGAKILDGTITSADIQDDSITTNDIKDHSIQGPDIIAGTIGTGELTNGAITTGKISDGAVTSAKLAKHYLAGESIYNGKGFKIAQDIDNKGIRAPASCTCSVPTLAYTCNCWVVEVMIDEVSVYAYAYDKGGNDMAKTATIDWIVVEQ
jgi:hypothetical protein